MRAETTRRIKKLGREGKPREAVAELANMAKLGIQVGNGSGEGTEKVPAKWHKHAGLGALAQHGLHAHQLASCCLERIPCWLRGPARHSVRPAHRPAGCGPLNATLGVLSAHPCLLLAAPQPDTLAATALLDACARNGKMEMARRWVRSRAGRCALVHGAARRGWCRMPAHPVWDLRGAHRWAWH